MRKRVRPLPTVDRLREVLSFDPETGDIRWRQPGPKRRVGRVAGTEINGYRAIGIDGTILLAHRIAWALMTGEWPTMEIDHVDGNRSNNRWANLRQATRTENAQNLHGVRRNNTSGYTGVSWSKSCRKWIAQISINGRAVVLGQWDDPAMAHESYLANKRMFHPTSTAARRHDP